MSMFQRSLTQQIENKLFSGKVIIIAGARQVGKTTMAKRIINDTKHNKNVIFFNCDDPNHREQLNNRSLTHLQQLIGTNKIIFIDEGQKVESIGQTLKLLVDHYQKTKHIIVTGSSSFNLLNNVNEALTGRKYLYTLYPLSIPEIYPTNKQLDLMQNLPSHLIYGSYPDIVLQNNLQDKTELLHNLVGSYLFKDILEFQQLKNPAILHNLLRVLALQIGQQVSYNELANLLNIDKKTVERYVDLLEKNFIVFRLPPFVKQRRREISKLRKVYFYDVGIRNTILNNFNELSMRNDTGALWENFIVTERMKTREYLKIYANQYFWRTYDGSEIDLVEELSVKLHGYEIKWNEKKANKKPPQSWSKYEDSTFTIITKNNFLDFLSK